MYDAFNSHCDVIGQSPPTPIIHVVSLVWELQLYDDDDVVEKNGGELGS